MTTLIQDISALFIICIPLINIAKYYVVLDLIQVI